MCANGCGPSYFSDSFRARLSKYHVSACNSHDAAYEQGGNELDRIKADYKFAADMMKKTHPIAVLIAPIFFLLVRFGGWGSFKYGAKK